MTAGSDPEEGCPEVEMKKRQSFRTTWSIVSRQNCQLPIGLGVFLLSGLVHLAGQSIQTTPGNSPSAPPSLSDRSVWVHLRPHLKAVGDRMYTQSKERRTIIGTLTRSSGSTKTSSPITIVAEVSGNFRLDEQAATGLRTVGINGTSPFAGSATPSASDYDTLETLLNDSAEHFFLTQMTGMPTRFYGAHFRFDDGKAKNYTGPYYDVYEVGDMVATSSQPVRRTKVYCLNSITLFLERVHYEVKGTSGPVRVEVVLSNWQKFGDQYFPMNVDRTENGATVLSLSIANAAVGPSAQDGIFNPK